MQFSNNIKYIGVNDHQIDLFEGQYVVPNGMSYNSYVIFGEKIAVMDTVDSHFTDIWLNKLSYALDGKNPDYLVVQHMEPDHSGSILAFESTYPNATIVASSKAFTMMHQFFNLDCTDKQIIAEQGSTLDLGNHSLTFIPAPMVHWPEVIVTYESTEKVLFSADAFGKFGALDVEDEWKNEASRYYFGIVGKYGAQVQTLLKKASSLEINTICPLHGPVLQKELLCEALNLYNVWSSYSVDTEGVFIAYTSIYGHTKNVAEVLYRMLKENGCNNVEIMDLSRDDMAECVKNAFCYGTLVLASPTYNSSVFPFMNTFLSNLTERNYQNRSVALVENGSWAPTAATVMKKLLSNCKNLSFVDPVVTIRGSLNKDSDKLLKKLATELLTK